MSNAKVGQPGSVTNVKKENNGSLTVTPRGGQIATLNGDGTVNADSIGNGVISNLEYVEVGGTPPEPATGQSLKYFQEMDYSV